MASIVHFEIDRNVHLLESVICALLGAALQNGSTVRTGLDTVCEVDPWDSAMANPLIEEPPHVLAQDFPGDALQEVGRPHPVLRGPREKAPQDPEEMLVPCDAVQHVKHERTTVEEESFPLWHALRSRVKAGAFDRPRPGRF